MNKDIDLDEISFIEESFSYQKMNKKEKERFNNILNQLKRDTENSFSATEYHYLAMLKFFGEEIETIMIKETFQNTDDEIRKEYRRLAESVLSHMQRFRENKRMPTDSIKILKQMVKNEEEKNGDNRN